MITNKIIIREALLKLVEEGRGTFPLESVNESTKNYSIDFLVSKEKRKLSLSEFVNEYISPMILRLTDVISKKDSFCFLPESTLEQLRMRDSNCDFKTAKLDNIELLLIESYYLECKSPKISIQVWVNKK